MLDLSSKPINWKRVLLIVGIAFLLMLIAAGGYWYWLSKQKNNSASTGSGETAQTTTSQTESNSTATPSATTPTTGTTTSSSSKTGSSSSSNTNGSSSNSGTNTPAVTFAVTGVTADADHTSVCSNVTTTVHFTGHITANAAGTVHYRWIASDGGTLPEETVTFTAAGSKTVTTDWTLGGGGVTKLPWMLRPFVSVVHAITNGTQYWEKVVISSPNSISSNQATFTSAPCIN